MTLLPAANRDVKGLEGPKYPKYKVGPLCCAPGCSKLADHAHHIWRRSFLAGDYAWVKLWDGTIVGNLCGLCWRHHQEITENKVAIEYTNDGGEALGGPRFVWKFSPTWVAHLDPQPPFFGVSTKSETPKTPHEHVGPASGETCPTCNRVIRQKIDGPKEKARARKAWTITVPVDERENGADVLDVLLEECAKIFGHDDTRTLKYFTLVQALSLVVQHGDRMVSDE